MSDHPKEAQRNLKRIVICDDVYLDGFLWLPPAKVGLELALVSCRFDALVDAHFRYRRWTFGKWAIVKSTTTGKTQFVKIWNGWSESLPIPLVPLPNKVVGFARIKFRYATDDSIAFLRRIERLFQSDITLELFAVLGDDLFPNSIWPLLNPSAGIVKMRFQNGEILNDMCRLISPSVLRDCANLRFVYIRVPLLSYFDLEFPPEDSAGASHRQSLCKWLHTPFGDGRPKVLIVEAFGFSTLGDLHMEFRSATTGVSFIILTPHVGACCFGNLFEEENSLTHERLTLRPIENNAVFLWMILRSPIDKNAHQWAEWEREAMEENFDDWKVLEFGDQIL